MQIKYITRDLREIKITPDIEASVEKKMARRLKKYSHGNQEEQQVTVSVSELKPRLRVDIELTYLNYRVHAEADVTFSEGVLGGVEKCLDGLDRQIEKYKTKIHKSVHRNKGKGLNKADFEAMGIDLPADVNIGSNYDGESEVRRLIKVENYELKHMNADEAALQLEVLDYKFLFFRNDETGRPCVIYKRDDGNIGLIEE